MPDLHDNFVAPMDAATFLSFYVCASITLIVVGWMIMRVSDTTWRLPTPDVPKTLDPHAIAYLRGGVDYLINLAAFRLMSRRYLVKVPVPGEGTETFETRKVESAGSMEHLHPIDVALLDRIDQSRNLDPLICPSTAAELDVMAADIRQDLLTKRLLATKPMRALASRCQVFGGLLIFGLGGYWCFVDSSRTLDDIGPIVMIAIVALFFLGVVCLPQRMTHLGRRYFKRVKKSSRDLAAKVDPADSNRSATLADVYVAIYPKCAPTLLEICDEQ